MHNGPQVPATMCYQDSTCTTYRKWVKCYLIAVLPKSVKEGVGFSQHPTSSPEARGGGGGGGEGRGKLPKFRMLATSLVELHL